MVCFFLLALHSLFGVLLTLLLRFCFSLFLFLKALAYFLGQSIVARFAERFALVVIYLLAERLVATTTHKVLWVEVLA